MLLATDSISCVAWDDWISSALRIIVIDTASPVRVALLPICCSRLSEIAETSMHRLAAGIRRA
jgi:hypothetical protein